MNLAAPHLAAALCWAACIPLLRAGGWRRAALAQMLAYGGSAGLWAEAPLPGAIVGAVLTAMLLMVAAVALAAAQPQPPVSSTTIVTVLPRDSGSQPAAMAEAMARATRAG